MTQEYDKLCAQVMEQVQDSDKLRSELDTKEEELQTVHLAKQQLEAIVDDLMGQVSQFAVDHEQSQMENNDLIVAVQELSAKSVQLEEQTEELLSENKLLHESIAELSKENSVLLATDQQLQEALAKGDAMLKEKLALENQLQQFHHDMEESQDTVNVLREENVALKKQMKRNVGNPNECDRLEQQQHRLQEKVTSLEQTLQETEAHRLRLEGDIEESSNIRDQLEQELCELKCDLQRLESQLKENGEKLNQHRRVSKEFEAIVREKEATIEIREQRSKELEAIVKEKDTVIERRTQQIKELQAIVKEKNEIIEGYEQRSKNFEAIVNETEGNIEICKQQRKELETIVNEKDAIISKNSQQHDNLWGTITDNPRGDLEHLETLPVKVATIENDRRLLQVQMEALHAEKEVLKQQFALYIKKIGNLVEVLSAQLKNVDHTTLMTTDWEEQLKHEKDQLNEFRQKLANEQPTKHALENELKEWQTKHEGVRYESMQKRKENLEHELQQATKARDDLEQQLTTLKRLQDQLDELQKLEVENSKPIAKVTHCQRGQQILDDEKSTKNRQQQHFNDELKVRQQSLLIEMDTLRRFFGVDRKNRRQSTHDDRRGVMSCTRDVTTVTDATATHCCCTEKDAIIQEQKKQLIVKDCKITSQQMMFTMNPLQNGIIDLCKRLEEAQVEKSFLKDEIRRLRKVNEQEDELDTLAGNYTQIKTQSLSRNERTVSLSHEILENDKANRNENDVIQLECLALRGQLIDMEDKYAQLLRQYQQQRAQSPSLKADNSSQTVSQTENAEECRIQYEKHKMKPSVLIDQN